MARMKTLMAFMALAVVLAGAGAGEAYTWYSYGGHQYAFTNTANTWANDEAEAVSAGGHLVTINDQAEQDWLLGQFGSSTRYWIGFTDQAVEGTWQWISGEAVTYTNWNFGEPNQAGNEDYAVMNWGSNGRWNDWPGSNSLTGIIEVVPLPGTLLLLGSGLSGLWFCRRRKL